MTMRGDKDDAQALLRVSGREPEAFGAFYRLFERRMLGFFMRATGRPELAADLTAETFARALEGVERYDERKGLAEQWLFGIARNVLHSSYRQGRVEATARERLGLPKLVLEDDASEAIERLLGEDQALLALASLPDEQQHAVRARVLEGYEYAEIAGELRCSEALVRQRVSRGLRALRTQLECEG